MDRVVLGRKRVFREPELNGEEKARAMKCLYGLWQFLEARERPRRKHRHRRSRFTGAPGSR